MNKRLRVALAITLMGSSLARPVAAEDIDIYTMAQTTQAAPNVLLFIDNSANWSAMDQAWDKTEVSAKCNGDATCLKYVELVFGSNTRLAQGQVEVRALKAVIEELACNSGAPFNVNLGLMLYTSGTADGTNVVSGYIRRAVQSLAPLSEGCTNLKNDFTLIDSKIQSDEFKGPSSTDYGTAMFEVFKYFGGYANTNGVTATASGSPTGAKGFGTQRYTDKDAKVSGSLTLKDMEDSTAFTTGTRDTYLSPIHKDSCGNNYLVVIGNQFPNQEFGSNTTANPATNQVMGYLGLKPNQLFSSTNKADIRFADEWAQFLARTDVSPVTGHQPVKTFTINVFNKKEDLAQTALLNSMARNGGSGVGGAFKVNGDLKALVDGLKTIFMQINAVNSSFASASLPISVNTQGTYLNQVFIGMFRPDTKSRPRWAGNLKQYQFALQKTVIDDVTTRSLFIADADGVSAIDNANTGFLQACARSFWTTNSGEYWKTVTESPTPDYDIPDGSCVGSEFNDKPDGRVVERGGVAQQLRELATPADRKIETCAAAPVNCTSSTAFTVSTDDERWIRGDNVGDGYNTATTTVNEQYQRDASVIRPTIHGAVIHSRPLAINYGSSGTNDIVVFYGTDDGLLRAVDGNKTESVSRSGTELWAFLAPEFKARLKRNRDNFPLLTFKDDPTAPKDYFFDGSIGAYIGPEKADGTGARVTYIYPSMRRGGTMIYAFNATQHPATSAPVPLWRFGCDQTGECYGTDAEKLGQTWSAPRVVRVKGQSKLYTVFGAGYDACEDKEPRDCTNAKTGSGIFVLDAATGDRLRYIDFGADAGRVVADLVPADTNDDGYSDVIYASDTSGNVWRINLTDPAKSGTQSQSDWTVTHVARVGDWTTANTRNRKFLYAPDVVRVGSYNIVLIGSGNREKPLSTSAAAKVKNRFYGLWDEYGVSSGFVTIDDRKDCDAAGDTVMTSTSCQLMNTSTTTLDYNPVFSSIITRPRGWVIDLDDTSDIGPNEQIVTTPATIGGMVNFSTFQAKNNDLCSSLGTARGYAACFLHGGATCDAPPPEGTIRSATFVGGGMAPSPVVGTVEMTSSDGSKEIVPFIIGGPPNGDCKSAICGDDVKIPIRKDRTKVYRYKKID
ncbi:putative type 4 pilus biogenesis protein [Azoarcus sp. CIB]|uniref:pilus assembly protein n=1 Tax=Aromatoleum sp. (strain CIB) TaxID=198107 RepID=UPI00067AF8AF|nr:PilC/PilY family type IV pilus protein [Azoarcus sp. CIB]AKU13011.1 putative type 4 pilus biogenesis protein [Azoarcus sp. CIB]